MNPDTLLLELGAAICAIGYGFRLHHWFSGKETGPRSPIRTRARSFLERVVLQRPFRSGGWRAPLMHGLIFWGCAGLGISSLELLPGLFNFRIFEPADLHGAALLAREAGTLALVAGCAMAIHRRYVKRWERLTLDLPGDRLILALLFAIPLTGIFTVGARLSGQPLEAEPIALSGHAASWLLTGMGFEPAYASWRSIHVVMISGFLALLPFTRLRHILVAPLAVLIGQVRESENVEGNATDVLPWLLRLQLDACSGCGRCDSACPPTEDGTPLSPQSIVIAQRSDERARSIEDAALADCSLCGACEEACPAGISHLTRLRSLKLQRDPLHSSRDPQSSGAEPTSVSELFPLLVGPIGTGAFRNQR
ncbi:MAG: 4Fe-4S dicluster domain-containing protein [bacterium]|nr:4Fe-4S dicluster domain-containing protein [bacterium]